MKHPNVHHPKDLVNDASRGGDKLLDFCTDHILASRIMFFTALIVPLLVLPMSDSVKLTVGVISGSWFQWWALPALQRRQNQTDAKRDAKADADHEALSYLARAVDKVLARVEEIHQTVAVPVHTVAALSDEELRNVEQRLEERLANWDGRHTVLPPVDLKAWPPVTHEDDGPLHGD